MTFIRCISRRLVLFFFIGLSFGVFLERTWFHFYHNEYRDITLTCLVVVRNCEHLNAAQSTWLRNCDKKLIIAPEKRNEFLIKPKKKCNGTISLSVDSGWEYLCNSFHLLPEIQWLIVVVDSTYVVVDNLKRFLQDNSWRVPRYIGHAVGHYNGDFNTLSAGIVMNNGSISALLSRFPDPASCRNQKFWNSEDKYLGQVLAELGISVEDTRDQLGRDRFHGYSVNTLLSHGKLFRRTDYFKKSVFAGKEGRDCCSEDLITVDTSDADHMRIHHFLIYSGGSNKTPKINVDNESPPAWIQALREIGYDGPIENITSQKYFEIWEKHISPKELNEKIRKTVS